MINISQTETKTEDEYTIGEFFLNRTYSGDETATSLAQAADWATDDADFNQHVKAVIDYSCSITSDHHLLIEEEPSLLYIGGMSIVFDVSLAGLAEMIAAKYGLPCPEWANKPCRFLPEPVYFGSTLQRGMVIDTTPRCMSRRNLFCGAVALE